ncbi:MAG: hypothetical protein AAB834_00370, partial [Patescibacteria group bacterium]
MAEFGPVPPIVDTYFGRGAGFADWEDLTATELARLAFNGRVEPEDRVTALRMAEAQYAAAASPDQGNTSWQYFV